MKYITTTLIAFVLSLSLPAQNIEGAWKFQSGSTEHTAVFVDGYFSYSVFDLTNKKFISTKGGPYSIENNTLKVEWQYDTEKAGKEIDTWLGKTASFTFRFDGTLNTNISGQESKWQRIDENNNPLSGVWRITGRKQGDEVQSMPLRDRRTLKIMSGTRFQWVAINIKTGEFSGTGGGRYTFENGQYAEHIEFFSRDNNRVGSVLTFNAAVEGGNWIHSGLSSSGSPIYEVWSKMK